MSEIWHAYVKLKNNNIFVHMKFSIFGQEIGLRPKTMHCVDLLETSFNSGRVNALLKEEELIHAIT